MQEARSLLVESLQEVVEPTLTYKLRYPPPSPLFFHFSHISSEIGSFLDRDIGGLPFQCSTVTIAGLFLVLYLFFLFFLFFLSFFHFYCPLLFPFINFLGQSKKKNFQLFSPLLMPSQGKEIFSKKWMFVNLFFSSHLIILVLFPPPRNGLIVEFVVNAGGMQGEKQIQWIPLSILLG